MSSKTDLAALQAAYKAWHTSKGQRTDAWLDLAADEIRVTSIGAPDGPLAFGTPRKSKHEFVEYLTSLLAEWQMVHWTPETFVCDGENIAMFGRCAWTHKRTGKTVEIDTAHLWQFKDGKIVALREIFDSARAVAAATA